MMTRENVSTLAADLKRTLEQFAKEHGVEFQYMGGKFDDATFTPRILFKDVEGQASAFRRNCNLVGMKPEDHGRTFNHGGRTYTIIDLNFKSRRRPVICKSADGKTWNFPVEMVQR